MFTKPKNAHSLTHTIIWDILYCYRKQRGQGAGRMASAIRSVRLRGSVCTSLKIVRFKSHGTGVGLVSGFSGRLSPVNRLSGQGGFWFPGLALL